MKPAFPRAFLSLLAAAVLAAALASVARTAPVAPARRAAPTRAVRPPAAAAPAPAVLATEARTREDEGAYARAADALRRLRASVPRDADLELALALDEARSNALDSAWVRLNQPLLSAALVDTAVSLRWHPLGAGRERTWTNGRFDGWYWSVARGRAEVALRLRRWSDALAAARVAARAHPLSGRDHLLLALTAGRAGDAATARSEAARAVLLDPMLPEAHYLHGLWAWRDGDRLTARREFEAAIARDSVARFAALALVRLQVPGCRPDSLPDRFLTGARRAASLATAVGPKLDETLGMDELPGLYGGLPSLAVSDSERTVMALDRPLHLEPTVLVSEDGRPLAIEFPYLPPAKMPATVMNRMVALAERWRFKPAVRAGRPARVWINAEIVLNP